MALREREDSMTYVGVYDGAFEVRVDKNTPGAVERERTKKGKPTGEVIHVKKYGSLEGTIQDVKKDMRELPDGTKFSSLKIFIDDVGDKYVLNWPYNSDLTTAFFCMMENINFSFPVDFSVGKSKDKKGKEKTSLFLKQHGKTLKWRYTRDYQYADGEIKRPEWVQIQYKGELVWDNTAETQFFEAIMKDKILPLLRGKSDTPQSVPQESALDDSGIPSHVSTEESRPVDDFADLPF